MWRKKLSEINVPDPAYEIIMINKYDNMVIE